MNPSASPFTPGPTPPPDTTAEELRNVNKSLCKALAEARQAQNTTKLALEEETTKRAKAEEEINSLLRTNSSLASTAQMLGAIVKHNINTPNKTLAGATGEFQSLDLQNVTNICTPYQCRPKWAILQNRPLFDDDEELARARRLHGGQQQHSTFWQHPVRYMPASDEKNLCRTLIIDFLPLDTTMKDVLALIRGGALESIQLFEPIGIATDFKTARVVFHYEIPACDMYAYWQKYGLTLRNQSIRVLQLGYTYPKNCQLDEDVFIRCYTRILLIDNINDRVIQRLPAYLDRQIKIGSIIEIGQADDGVTMIEFTSVREAAKAMRAMQTEEMFHGAVFDFEDDYCQEGTYAY
jgi:hypothetical protein